MSEKLTNREKGFIITIIILGLIAIFSPFYDAKEDLSSEELGPATEEQILNYQAENTCSKANDAITSRVEEKLGVRQAIEITNIKLHKLETDFKENTTTEQRILWSVTCETDAIICQKCDLKTEKDCGCNKMIIRSYFNQSEINTMQEV